MSVISGQIKLPDITAFLEFLGNTCPELQAIGLEGWEKLTDDHMAFLLNSFQLQRFDLSSITSVTLRNRSIVSTASLVNMIQVTGDRLTHLNLANNRLPGVSKVLTALTANCPNLELLDLSNTRTAICRGNASGIVSIEELQNGCSKLRILRLANSWLTFNDAPVEEDVSAVGFVHLEQLSVASKANEVSLVNDNILERLLKSSVNLKLLDIRGAKFSYQTLDRIPADRLMHLFLSRSSVTSEG